MLTSEILAGVRPIKVDDDLLGADVPDISADSRTADAGALFFAYKGTGFDSHEVVKDLYDAGKITGVICEHEVDGVPSIVVADGRVAFALGCKNFFGKKDLDYKLIGVTGTNGKTTVTWMLENIFNSAGIKTVRIGTTGANVAGVHYDIETTTPSAYEFHKFLAAGGEAGARVAIAEVSSHALHQDRLYGVVFDVAVFTNLSRDHLDYHKDMESYFAAKKLLFTPKYSKFSVVNTDDDFGARLYRDIQGMKMSYGGDGADLCVKEFISDIRGTDSVFSFHTEEFAVKSPLVGRFNVDNIMAASCAALVLGVTPADIRSGIGGLENIPGRMEKYNTKGITVFVDFSHTDESLRNALVNIKENSTGRIITVFGAGGDRDKGKRPKMGERAALYSDLSIVTSDNPRTEEPMSIINDILPGMGKSAYIVEPDRRKAIEEAVLRAEEGDVVLIAGKGHEEYQIIGREKFPFSDMLIAKQVLERK